jgi:hypothetical protein
MAHYHHRDNAEAAYAEAAETTDYAARMMLLAEATYHAAMANYEATCDVHSATQDLFTVLGDK